MKYFVMIYKPTIRLGKTDFETPLEDVVRWNDLFYSDVPFPLDAPQMKLNVNPGKHVFDILNTAACDSIFSKRMVELLNPFNIDHEELKISLKINGMLTDEYIAYHLLSKYNAINTLNSKVILNYGDFIDNLRFLSRDDLLLCNLHMFRDASFSQFVVISRNLKDELSRSGINCLVFMPIN